MGTFVHIKFLAPLPGNGLVFSLFICINLIDPSCGVKTHKKLIFQQNNFSVIHRVHDVALLWPRHGQLKTRFFNLKLVFLILVQFYVFLV